MNQTALPLALVGLSISSKHLTVSNDPDIPASHHYDLHKKRLSGRIKSLIFFIMWFYTVFLQ
jgi:hypothetical protein